MTEEDILGEGILTCSLKKGLKEFMKLYYILYEIMDICSFWKKGPQYWADAEGGL